MKRYLLAVLIVVSFVFVIVPAFAGPGLDQPFFSFQTFDPNGTPRGISALIDPPSSADGAGNIGFTTPSDSASPSIYWVGDDGQFYATQTHSHPNPVGDLLWQAKVVPGQTDIRTALNFNWGVDAGPYAWFVTMYRIDTRQCVFTRTISPGDVSWGNFSAPMSHSGYDLLAAAWDPTAPVPEPGSLLALGSGLVGMIGFAIRRRRQ